jgi:hypothetical protein
VRARGVDATALPRRACQGHDTAEIFTLLYNRYVPQCVEYVLTGVVDGQQAEKLRQVWQAALRCVS